MARISNPTVDGQDQVFQVVLDAPMTNAARGGSAMSVRVRPRPGLPGQYTAGFYTPKGTCMGWLYVEGKYVNQTWLLDAALEIAYDAGYR